MIQSPLAQKRIVITRPAHQADAFRKALETAGATPILFPTIAIEPITDSQELDRTLYRLKTDAASYDWLVFTSANGVDAIANRLAALDISVDVLNRIPIAVIGPATAESLERLGIRPSLQPESYVAESLAEELVSRGKVAGKRMLLLRADIARPVLRQLLSEQGAIVDEQPVYRTSLADPDPDALDALRAGVDLLTFTSSSTVRSFVEILGEEGFQIARNATVACIGPITEETALELGIRVDIVALEYTVPGLLAAMQGQVVS
jgi:uroporphyrinogen-III synthase